MIPKKNKLPAQLTFSLKARKTIQTRHLAIKVFSTNLDYPRFGVVISKKTAKSAVMRNKLKRAVFNAVKTIFNQINPADYLVIINQQLDPRDLQEELIDCFKNNV